MDALTRSKRPARSATMAMISSAAFPNVGYRVTDAFGVHEKLAEVVLERTGVVTPAHA